MATGRARPPGAPAARQDSGSPLRRRREKTAAPEVASATRPAIASRGDMADPALAPRRSGAPASAAPWLAGCTLASGLPARAAPGAGLRSPRAPRRLRVPVKRRRPPNLSRRQTPPRPRERRPLDHEPLLGVLLAGAPRVAIQLEAATTLEAPGSPSRSVRARWSWRAAASAGGSRGDARALTGKGVLASGGDVRSSRSTRCRSSASRAPDARPATSW